MVVVAVWVALLLLRAGDRCSIALLAVSKCLRAAVRWEQVDPKLTDARTWWYVH